MSICNRLDLQTLGSQLIMLKNFPDHCRRRPGHWGLLNGVCGFMGRPHPSHPFMALHLMVYGIYRATWKKIKTSNKWNFSRWEIDVCKMKASIVHPVVWEHLCGILKVPKFPMGFPGGTQKSHPPALSCLALPAHFFSLPNPWEFFGFKRWSSQCFQVQQGTCKHHPIFHS